MELTMNRQQEQVNLEMKSEVVISSTIHTCTCTNFICVFSCWRSLGTADRLLSSSSRVFSLDEITSTCCCKKNKIKYTTLQNLHTERVKYEQSDLITWFKVHFLIAKFTAFKTKQKGNKRQAERQLQRNISFISSWKTYLEVFSFSSCFRQFVSQVGSVSQDIAVAWE